MKDKVSSCEYLNRDELFRTQTPHTYPLKSLLDAHKKWKERKLPEMPATCALMNSLGEKIYFSKGSEKNLKITTMDDLDIFKALISAKDI